jgi:hypothetical protein
MRPRTARTIRRPPWPARHPRQPAGSRLRRRSAPSRAWGQPDRSARGPERRRESQAMPISWPPPIRMPIDAADHRLVAGEDGRDHVVVEQSHVLAVFLRMAGVVFRVLLGVAAGAEGLVARTGKHHAIDVARIRRGAESEDDPLDHVGGVGVVLRWVVQRDPCIEQAGCHAAVGPKRRTPLITYAWLGDVVDQVMTFQFAHSADIFHCDSKWNNSLYPSHSLWGLSSE